MDRPFEIVTKMVGMDQSAVWNVRNNPLVIAIEGCNYTHSILSYGVWKLFPPMSASQNNPYNHYKLI